MVRGELQLGEDKLADAKLRSLWVCLDDDGSGYITAKEFGRVRLASPRVERKPHAADAPVGTRLGRSASREPGGLRQATDGLSPGRLC